MNHNNICYWKFAGKSVSSSFTMTRHVRADSESLSDKDREWNVEDSHKDREIERLINYFFIIHSYCILLRNFYIQYVLSSQVCNKRTYARTA